MHNMVCGLFVDGDKPGRSTVGLGPLISLSYCTWGKLEYNLSQMEQLTSNWFLTDHVMTTHLTWQHLKLNLFPFQ